MVKEGTEFPLYQNRFLQLPTGGELDRDRSVVARRACKQAVNPPQSGVGLAHPTQLGFHFVRQGSAPPITGRMVSAGILGFVGFLPYAQIDHQCLVYRVQPAIGEHARVFDIDAGKEHD